MNDDSWTREDRYYSEHEPTGDRISACRVLEEWKFTLWIKGKPIGMYQTGEEAKRAQKKCRENAKGAAGDAIKNIRQRLIS